MDSKLTSCDPNETFQTLATSVGILLHGVPRDQRAFLPEFDSLESREQAWSRFTKLTLRPVQAVVSQAYQAANENRLEDILALSWQESVPPAALELTQTILLTSSGARHERLLSRLAEAASAPCHPCVALAARAAAFNEPAVVAQVAYYYQEWQAASSGLETTRLQTFLERQPGALLTLPPSLIANPQSPFLKASKQHDQQRHG